MSILVQLQDMFAIVTISGKQYTVTAGDVILVDKIDGEEGSTVVFDHVLLTTNKGKTTVGTPVVSGAKVTAKIVSQQQGDKVQVSRFKSKVRERRHIGFRPQYTKLEIVSVG